MSNEAGLVNHEKHEKTRKGLVPRLRFPEFRDAPPWDQSKLVDKIETITPPKKLQTSQYLPNGRFPIIDQSPDDTCGWTDDKDAVVAGRLPAIVFGDHTCTLKLVKTPFAQGADGIKIFVAKGEVSTEYLYHFLSSRPVKMESYKRHFTTLKNIQVYYPGNTFEEQQKIADCLGSLDDLIAAEGRKLAALRDHKKGLMQQLFPHEGETRPRLRFPEFQDTGEWEERPFYDLFDAVIDFRGRTPKKLGMEWGGGNIIALSANNVKNGFIDLTAECYLGSDDLHARWMGDVNLSKGDIVFSMEAPLGNALLIPDDSKYILSQRVVAFKSKSTVVSEFVLQLIWSDCFQVAITQLSTGSTAKGISQKALQRIAVHLPKKAEQQRIADCLSALDDLIAAQAQKLDALRTHKRGLMQQLFPSPEDVEA